MQCSSRVKKKHKVKRRFPKHNTKNLKDGMPISYLLLSITSLALHQLLSLLNEKKYITQDANKKLVFFLFFCCTWFDFYISRKTKIMHHSPSFAAPCWCLFNRQPVFHLNIRTRFYHKLIVFTKVHNNLLKTVNLLCGKAR
jgi:hypothetical protein